MKIHNSFLKIAGISLMFTLLTASKPANTYVDYAEVLKRSDMHLGGQITGVAWDINVENYEQGELKNSLGLLVEASTTGNQKLALITFLEPKKFTGQKLLLRDNNMWFIKKGLNQPLPISGRQRLTGSAANADVASSNYSIDYNITETKEEVYNNQACYVFMLEAKNSFVSYSKIRYWVTKDENLALKSEYYGKSNNKLIKTATFEYGQIASYKAAKTKFVSKISIFDNIDSNDKTLLKISGIRFQNFDNSKFEKNNLN